MIIIKNRELLIPGNERYIGTNYDTGMENRVFRIPRLSQSGTDLSDLTFKVNLIFNSEPLDTAELQKNVDDDYIYLTWTVTAAQVAVTGTVFVCVTGNDTNDTVKWSTFMAPFYTEKSLGEDVETEYKKVIAKVNKEIEDREAADAALQNSINVERARIDQITNLPSGSTTGDAELQDIRVAYDGITYTNAGTSVRTQTSHLHRAINSSELMERVYFTNYQNGVKVNSSGAFENASGNCCTEFIPVNGILNLCINRAYHISSGFSIAWFNKNHGFISGQMFAKTGGQYDYEVLVPPTGAEYVVISNSQQAISDTSNYAESPQKLSYIKNNVLTRTHLMSFTDGYYLNTSGVRVSNSGWYVTDLIPVHDIYHIHVNDNTRLAPTTGVNVAFYRQENISPFNATFINGFSLIFSTNDEWGVVPDGATHMCLSLQISKRSPLDYVETITPKYKKLTLNSATAIYEFLKNPVEYTEIDLLPGTYDLYAAGFNNDIAADTIYYKYMNNVIFKGNGSTLTLNCPEDIAEAHPNINYLSVLNVLGNFEARDLNIICENIRYGIHSECQEAPGVYGSKLILKNVRVQHSTEVEGLTNGNAIGIGGSKYQQYLFENCDFSCSSTFPAFYIHGRLFNIESIKFKNCTFNDGAHIGILLSQYTGNGIQIPVDIDSCLVGTILCKKQGLGTTYDYQYVISAINSYISAINVDSDITFIRNPRRINTITGEVNTTYTTNEV